MPVFLSISISSLISELIAQNFEVILCFDKGSTLYIFERKQYMFVIFLCLNAAIGERFRPMDGLKRFVFIFVFVFFFVNSCFFKNKSSFDPRFIYVETPHVIFG